MATNCAIDVFTIFLHHQEFFGLAAGVIESDSNLDDPHSEAIELTVSKSMFETILQTASVFSISEEEAGTVKHLASPYFIANNTEFSVRYMLGWGINLTKLFCREILLCLHF